MGSRGAGSGRKGSDGFSSIKPSSKSQEKTMNFLEKSMTRENTPYSNIKWEKGDKENVFVSANLNEDRITYEIKKDGNYVRKRKAR